MSPSNTSVITTKNRSAVSIQTGWPAPESVFRLDTAGLSDRGAIPSPSVAGTTTGLTLGTDADV